MSTKIWVRFESTGNECPGAGLCHGALKWCDVCGDVKHICDARLRGERCAEHPVPPDVVTGRAAHRAAEKMIRDGNAMARDGERALQKAIDDEMARRAYANQLEELAKAEMSGRSKT